MINRRNTAARPLLGLLVTASAIVVACSSADPGSGGSCGTSGRGPASCSSTAAPTPLPASKPLWSPPGAAAPIQAVIKPDAVVQMRVGQRLRFREVRELVTAPQSTDPQRLTWYGDTRTFLALAPGTVAINVINYDSDASCSHGACAHLNPSIPMSVQIAADPQAPVPQYPSLPPIASVASQQLIVQVGQPIDLGPGVELRGSSGSDSLLAAGAGNGYVATRPGNESFEMDNVEGTSGAGATLSLQVRYVPPAPCALLSGQDVAAALPTVVSTRFTAPAEGIGPIATMAFCSYWAAEPGAQTPMVVVGLATDRRSAEQLSAEVAQYATDGDSVVADAQLPDPAYLLTRSGGLPDLQVYAIKNGVEVSVELRAANATRAAVETLARSALSRV